MSDGSIAIVGAACRFPGASDLEAFWRLLSSGTDAISEVSDERWSTRFFYHPSRGVPGKSYTWSAGLISGVDLFEPAFFGISPREAGQMDPQQRILLELVWHATEDAGIPASKLAGSATGVYIGASSTDYRDLRLGDPASGDSYFMTGSTLSIAANRISYVYDLRGPSLTIDTACSSSLVALHEACEAIRSGRIGAAIVGGINLLLAPYPFLGFSHASMLSRRGRCFAFDERADGYVRGEGGGAVILKPLKQALADGDRIRGVILSTGVNSDGRTIGLSLPNDAAQAALIRSVCARGGVAPDDLAFFEMHGTGTPAGDPIEAKAVGEALGQGRQNPLPIGSVKTNIGHLEPASGMAGLIKAALALDRRVLLPTLHCETPNPNISFDELNLRLIREPEAIGSGRCAGINSFGFGGTNAHALLAEPPRPAASEQAESSALPPLVLSARTESSLRALAENWRETLTSAPSERAPVLFRAAARQRDHRFQRLVAWGNDPNETAAALAEFLAGADHPRVVTGTALREGKLAFVFSGNGAQWAGMARETYAASAAFRAAVAEADAALVPWLGWSVADAIERGVEAEQLARADIAQPLLFAIQVGIVVVLRQLGVEASGHVGHSVGEIAAAWATGALSLPDAARVVAARSRHQERTRGQGRMAALALGAEPARELIAEIGSPLEVGAINATQSVTVSGPSEAIDHLEGEARRRGVALRGLDLDFAFHSAAMDPIRDGLLADLVELSSSEPNDLLVSTVTAQPVHGGLLDADYWWLNIRHPVRFSEAMAALGNAGYRIFLEIGPNPVLQSYLHDALRAAEGQGRVLSTLSRKQGPDDPFPAIAAHCHVAGYDITATERFSGIVDPSGLPLYPWDKERFWFERTVEDHNPANPPRDHPLLGFRQPGASPFWINHLDPELLPWLADHAVEGVPILPATAVLEMALWAARLRRPDARAIEVLDVELRRPLPFEKNRSRELRSSVDGEDGDWQLASRPRLSEEAPTLHAVARLSSAGDQGLAAGFTDTLPVQGEVDPDMLYRLAAQFGLDYGPQFRTVSRIELLGDGEAWVHLDPSVIAEPLESYLIHPALLDGALQGFIALLGSGHEGRFDGISFLPWRFGRVRIMAPFGRVPARVRLRVTRLGTRSASADIVLFDRTGNAMGELVDCWFRRVELSRRVAPEDRTLRIDLVPAPLTETAAPSAVSLCGDIVRHALDRRAELAAKREEHVLLLDALLAAVARDAVLTVAGGEDRFSVDELVETGALAPESAGLLDYLLDLLTRFGAVSAEGPVWLIVAENDLPEVAEVWRLLLAEAPDLVAELALVAQLSEELPSLLRDGPPAADTLAPPMVEALLHGSPASAAGIALVCDVLGEIAAAWPEARPMRILDLGAEGGATRRILERLAASGVAFEYRATNPDQDEAGRLLFAISDFPGASAECWSPRNGAEALGERRFDVIVSVQACARLQVEPEMLAGFRELLLPGGLFLGVEPAPNPLWMLVFGRYAGWWQQQDFAVERSYLRSGDEWRSEFALAGFAGPGAAELGAAPWPSSVLWARAPAEVAVAPATRAAPVEIELLSLGDSPLLDMLRYELAQAGHCVAEVDAVAFASPLADLDAAQSKEAPARLALLVIDDEDNPAGLISLLARIGGAAAQRDTPLWVITTGAQQGGGDLATGLTGAALWGFGRVLMNEMPRLSLRLFDLAPGFGLAQRADRILAEVAANSPETEIVWTESGRHVLRLRRGLPFRWAKPEDAVALTAEKLGGLDALNWSLAAERPVGPGEVGIEVQAAALNFRDMMWAMGLLPEEALIDGFAGPTLGLECAGIVSEVGLGVTHLRVGDRVAGLASAAFSTHVTTAAHAVTSIPPEIDFAAAATIPVAFVTVVYALGTLGRLSAGEHVLIHAAAGGVGLAAIQYAKHRGATVIATAGSEVKRAFLRLAGADHVLDSRDPGFADSVRAITGGPGVDLVLNSLSGEAMEQSLGVVKPFGRFLELGKRDFYLNRRIHLRPLRQNISYFAIDVDQLPVQRPDLARALLDEVSAALSEGAIRPLAHRSFGFGAIEDAFRLMQSSGHIGKLVVEPRGNRGVRLRHAAELTLRRDGTYLVTGGVSGFGFAAARWLAQNGAGNIALLSRRGLATPGAAERLAEIRALGAEAQIFTGDVTDRVSLAGVIQAIRASLPPLRGVVHAASAIVDALATELDGSTIERVLAPKVGGAVLLDELTRSDPVELFLLFSSATTLLGAPGQGVYVAANVALEALARHRRAQGRPALAIAWGPIEDAGYLAERQEAREGLARRLGAKPMPAAQALAGLPTLTASGLSLAAFADTAWHEARRYLPILATPLFAELRTDAASSIGDDTLIEQLAALERDEAVALLKTVVAEEAANILRLPAASIDPARPLSEVGMDSLMAVELRLALESRLRIDLPLMSLAEGTSVGSIATRLANTVSAGSQSAELVSLAERYEAADGEGLGAVARAGDEPFDALNVKSAAAE